MKLIEFIFTVLLLSSQLLQLVLEILNILALFLFLL